MIHDVKIRSQDWFIVSFHELLYLKDSKEEIIRKVGRELISLESFHLLFLFFQIIIFSNEFMITCWFQRLNSCFLFVRGMKEEKINRGFFIIS